MLGSRGASLKKLFARSRARSRAAAPQRMAAARRRGFLRPPRRPVDRAVGTGSSPGGLAIRTWLNSEPFPVQARSNLLHLLSLPDVADAGPMLALALAALVVLVVALLRPAPESTGPRTSSASGHVTSATGWAAALARNAHARQPADVCRTSGEERRGNSLGNSPGDSLRPVPVPLRLAAVTEWAANTPLRAPGSRPGPDLGPGLRPSTFPRPPRDAASPAGPQAPPG